ncbi:uncharacterized protein Dwil_GK22980 [Drosophila willistoni]|uniref:GH18 domain-containing protein n=2 Tax=Drosophila willistoni TaxID=7260 RepID=B4NN07_DROWI|nr:uncharacterized protein Dwil_GK22980 [Drosophila willistoni]
MMLIYLVLLCLLCHNVSRANVGRLVCYYDAASYSRQGPAHMSLDDLEPALNFCNFLVYGYVGIDVDTFKIKTHEEDSQQFTRITSLRRKYPHVRFLLSVGGDQDLNEEGKVETANYMSLIADPEKRNSFRASANILLNSYGFDGLDLAWQFPKMSEKKENVFKQAWLTIKSWFRFSSQSLELQIAEIQQQFGQLVRELRIDLQQSGKLLTFSVLPHVDVEMFVDVSSVMGYLDFVNLNTYDFQTPEYNPKEADIPSSLNHMYDRNPTHNIKHHVDWWLNATSNHQQLNLGVVAYGRTWIMSQKSGITGYPPIYKTDGPGPAGNATRLAGLLSWPEICQQLQHPQQPDQDTPHLRKVGDPTKRFGVYAYRSADENGANGLWVGYEDPTTAAIKAGYAQALGLGGVALHDLSLDDFRGQCAGEKYPILRSIKYKL